jgi:hypothetical protein
LSNPASNWARTATSTPAAGASLPARQHPCERPRDRGHYRGSPSPVPRQPISRSCIGCARTGISGKRRRVTAARAVAAFSPRPPDDAALLRSRPRKLGSLADYDDPVAAPPRTRA